MVACPSYIFHLPIVCIVFYTIVSPTLTVRYNIGIVIAVSSLFALFHECHLKHQVQQLYTNPPSKSWLPKGINTTSTSGWISVSLYVLPSLLSMPILFQSTHFSFPWNCRQTCVTKWKKGKMYNDLIATGNWFHAFHFQQNKKKMSHSAVNAWLQGHNTKNSYPSWNAYACICNKQFVVGVVVVGSHLSPYSWQAVAPQCRCQGKSRLWQQFFLFIQMYRNEGWIIPWWTLL